MYSRSRHRTLPALILMLGWITAAWIAMPGDTAVAHTFEPALLTIREIAASEYEVLWRPPGATAGYNLAAPDFAPRFPSDCEVASALREFADEAASTKVWRLRCSKGLRATVLQIPAIDGTKVDVVLRINWRDGSADSTVLRSGDSSYRFRSSRALTPYDLTTISKYFRVGVTHILFGFDHLAFVLGLFLLVATGAELLRTITAFTVGHSLTLALATYQVVQLPTALTEALIALSIAFVAREVLRPQRAAAHSSLVALLFGLLHGLGFAAALGNLGFEAASVGAALFAFNLGVEGGQIIFVMTLTIVAKLLRPLARRWPQAPRLLPYGIGSLAMLWLAERVLGFWSSAT